MFIRKFTYDSMLDLISDQKKEIEKLKAELKRSQRDLFDLQRFCMNYAADNHDFIDFPNSHEKGGNVVNTHLDSIDHISTYPIQRHNDGTQFFRF